MTIELVAIVVFAVVSGRRKDDDAGIDQPPHCAANRIVAVRIDRRHAKTHVDDANVVGSAIGGYPIQRTKHGCRGAESLRIQDAQVDEIGVWSNTDVLSI